MTGIEENLVAKQFKELNLIVVDYIDNEHIITWCEFGHEFETTANDILRRGKGCPECDSGSEKRTLRKYNLKQKYGVTVIRNGSRFVTQ